MKRFFAILMVLCLLPVHTLAASNDMQTSVMGFDSTLESVRIVVDGIVHHCDIQVSGNEWYLSKEDINAVFGAETSEEYVSLDAYAQYADISYTQDEVLSAAYFSTWESYAETASLSGFETYADELDLPLEKLEQDTVSGKEMAALLDCFVSHEAPEQLEEWKEISTHLRSSNDPLSRTDALSSLFLAAWKIGGNYMEYDKENHSQQMRDAAFDKENDERNWDLFCDVPIPAEFDVGYGAMDHYGCAACIFNLGKASPVDGSYPFSYDETSFRWDEDTTYQEAVLAILRVFSAGDMQTVSTDDSSVTTLSGVFTEKLLEKAKAPSTVTAENHPQWTGFVLNGEMGNNLKEVPDQVVLCAHWGFNSARLNLEYEQIFDREVTEVNLENLCVIDRIVAEAIKNNMHLNICLTSIPGRWRYEEVRFDTAGDFDLFLNEEKQEQAKRLYVILTERYKGISNDYLSFTLVWEPLNGNLSTGEAFEPYTAEDYAACLSDFVDVVREIDPERLIIVEPTNCNDAASISLDSAPTIQAMAEKGNIIFSYNFCEMPFVYACMTAESGRDIDNENRSYYLAQYPTYYYDLDEHIADPELADLKDMLPAEHFERCGSLLINGCLPAGTTVDLYIDQTYGGQLKLIADGEEIYTEQLEHQLYNRSESISGYIGYSTTDKKVSVTLSKDVELLEVATPGGALSWRGIDVWLPEEYAQEQWYYVTPYDVYQGLEEQEGIILKETSRVMIWPSGGQERNLTIHDDLSFSTPTIRESASKETMTNVVQTIESIWEGSIIRYERANFNGVICDEMLEYYEDMYLVLNEYGVGWWSNDWWVMTNDMSTSIAGVEQTSYDQYEYFNLELLQLMQRYQNSERP